MSRTVALHPKLTGRSRGHIVELAEPRCSLHRDGRRALPGAAGRCGRGRDRPAAGVVVPRLRPAAADLERASAAASASCCDRQRRAGGRCALWTRTRWSRPSCTGRRCRAPAATTGAPTSTSSTPPPCRPEATRPPLVRGRVRAGRRVRAARTTGSAHYAGEFGFYRPYASDRGGVQPEPWHLSYAPVARAGAGSVLARLLQRGAGRRAARRAGGGAAPAAGNRRALRGERGCARRRARRHVAATRLFLK